MTMICLSHDIDKAPCHFTMNSIKDHGPAEDPTRQVDLHKFSSREIEMVLENMSHHMQTSLKITSY